MGTKYSISNGQSVEIFYDFWCNWRSLKPFPPRVILTQEKLSEEKFGTGNKNYELFCSLKINGLAT